MRRVVIESPYAGNVERNLRYLRAAMRHSLDNNEAPFASHGLYAQEGMLDDTKPEQRRLGIEAGYAWGAVADTVAFYEDLGWSAGMIAARDYYTALAIKSPLMILRRSIRGSYWKE